MTELSSIAARGDFVKPVLQALVLADHIYQDKNTGKMIIAGTFARLLITDQSPSAKVDKATDSEKSRVPIGVQRAGSPYAYLCLTDIRGTSDLELRYIDLADNRVLFRAVLTVKCDNPLQSVEMNLPLPDLPRPHAGTYSLELLYDDELLGSWRVLVERIEETNEEE